METEKCIFLDHISAPINLAFDDDQRHSLNAKLFGAEMVLKSALLTLTATNECSIDGVLASPCSNGGLCVDLVGGYRCICSGTYQGPRCRELITGTVY